MGGGEITPENSYSLVATTSKLFATHTQTFEPFFSIFLMSLIITYPMYIIYLSYCYALIHAFMTIIVPFILSVHISHHIC